MVALAIADLCAGCTSFAELRAAWLLQEVRARLKVGTAGGGSSWRGWRPRALFCLGGGGRR